MTAQAWNRLVVVCWVGLLTAMLGEWVARRNGGSVLRLVEPYTGPNGRVDVVDEEEVHAP